jgi:hypothetical protein
VNIFDITDENNCSGVVKAKTVINTTRIGGEAVVKGVEIQARA